MLDNETKSLPKFISAQKLLEDQYIVRRVFTIHQLAHFLIIDLEKDIKKYKSKLLVITGDFFLSDSQITKQDKDWLYPTYFVFCHIKYIIKYVLNNRTLQIQNYTVINDSD